MRPLFVVVNSPTLNLATGVSQRREDAGVRAVIHQTCIKRLDEADVHRLAGPDQVRLDPVLEGSRIKNLRLELGPVVDLHDLRFRSASPRAREPRLPWHH